MAATLPSAPMDDFATAAASLDDLESLDVDALKVMYRVELAGEEFYERLAAAVPDDEAKTLLRRNGREERGHAERIRRMVGHKLGHDWEPDESDRAPLAVNLPEPFPLELLPAIVQGELNGDAGYQRWAENEPDPEVQRLLRLNGREETIHGRRVEEVLAILGQG
jgi:rubrerythrin